jgi:uncharacterized protein (TIGR02246 family)
MRHTARLCATLPLFVAACAPKGETAVNDSAATVTAPAVDPAAVRQAVDQTNAKMTAALQSGDTAAMASVYQDDAVVMMSGMPAWHGHADIATNGRGMFDAMKLSDVKFNTTSLDIEGDYAIETGTYEMTVTPKGGKPAPDKGKYITVWKKQADGSWKVYRDISNSDSAPKG